MCCSFGFASHVLIVSPISCTFASLSFVFTVANKRLSTAAHEISCSAAYIAKTTRAAANIHPRSLLHKQQNRGKRTAIRERREAAVACSKEHRAMDAIMAYASDVFDACRVYNVHLPLALPCAQRKVQPGHLETLHPRQTETTKTDTSTQSSHRIPSTTTSHHANAWHGFVASTSTHPRSRGGKRETETFSGYKTQWYDRGSERICSRYVALRAPPPGLGPANPRCGCCRTGPNEQAGRKRQPGK